MESTKQIRPIRPIRGQKSNPPPSLQGGAGGRHPFREGSGVGFPLTKREARLTKRACERLTKCEARLTHKKGVPSVSSVSSVSFRFWTKKSPVFGPNRNKTGVSSVSAVPSVPHQRGPLTKREARLTKRACERLTKCEARLTHKKGVSGFQVQDTHNASYFTNMTWIGLNLSGWNVTRLFHLRCFEL